MIYSVWYFCSMIKLPAIETQDVLKTVQVLENPHSSLALKKVALGQIYKYNIMVQAYLIPYLTRELLSLKEVSFSEERNKCIDLAENALLNILSEKNQSLTNFIRSLSEIEYEDAIQFVTNYHLEGRNISETSSLYSDVTNFVIELFLLSVISCVSDADSELVTGLVRGEDELKLIQNAKNGNYGLLCQSLSIKLWTQSGVRFYDAQRVLPRNWLSRPDMAEIAANLLFPDDQSHSIDNLLQEAYMLRYFQRYWYICEDEDDFLWITQGSNVKEYTRCCIIIWQAILWELALKRNQEAFEIGIQKYWGAHGVDSDKEGILNINQIQKILLPEKLKVANYNELKKYICSPWQFRSGPLFIKGLGNRQSAAVSDDEQYFHEFPSFRYTHNGLRAFLAVHLIQTILLNPQHGNVSDCIIALLLNLGDAFSCYGARNTLIHTNSTVNNVRISAWSYSVRALGYYAYDVLSRIGRGLLDPHIPNDIVDNIGRMTPAINRNCKHKNRQIILLYSSIAILIGLHWAFESLSATSLEIDRIHDTWFVDGMKSNAAKLCEWLFDKFKHQALSSRDAIQLNFLAFNSSYTLAEQERYPEWLDNLLDGTKTYVLFNNILLSRNPTYDEWCDIGEITPTKFIKDSYRIALTLRVRALLNSNISANNHCWINEWKNAMLEVSAPWELSRIVRYMMIQLLECVPKNKDNFGVLPDIYKIIIITVQEFSNITDIFYQYQLAQRLIALTSNSIEKRTLGDETVAYLRALFAKSLYCAMETADSLENKQKWELLLKYYLINITDSLQETAVRNAGASLRNYWRKKDITDNVLHVEKIPFSSWNPLIDRIWTVNGEKLQTARERISAKTNQSGEVSAWQLLSQDNKENQILGVVVYQKKFSNSYNYEIYCADGIIRSKKMPETISFDLGTLVRLILNKQGDTQIDRIYRLCRGGFPGEQAQVSYKINAEELRFSHLFQMKFNERSEPRLLQLWNGNSSELFSHDKQLFGKATAEYAEYCFGKSNWLPVEQDYIHFLLNVMFKPQSTVRECTLTYLGQARIPGYLLFSVKAGENYALGSDCWTTESLKRIEEKLSETQDNIGLMIHVGISNQNKLPYLELKGEYAFNDINIRWREQFSTDEIFQIGWNGERWVTDSKVPEISDKLTVLINSAHLDRNRCYNVQLNENGWSYRNQRTGCVEAIEVRSRKLNNNALRNLKDLIAIKPGDVLSLRSVRADSKAEQNYGYYQAELDSGIPVFCAAESYSFLADINASEYKLNRRCIVENVIYKSAKYSGEEAATPIDFPELHGMANEYNGIIPEFSPNLRSSIGVIISVLLDIEGEMQMLSVPISAFSIPPINLGDIVVAKRVETGWIFKSQRRSINVRALWTMEDHRDQEFVQLTGEFLGIIDIPHLGKCMVTQDKEKPILHLWKQNTDYQQTSKERFGVMLGYGKVTTIGRRYSDKRVFPDAFRTNVVALQNDGRIIIGEAPFGKFACPESNWRVKAKICLINANENLYDLHRCFLPSSGSQETESVFADSADEEHKSYYMDWLNTGDYHVKCKVSGPLGQAEYVQLYELFVPTLTDINTDHIEWTNNVALMQNLQPLVRGRRYSFSDIRVKLKINNNKWVASVQDTEPLMLDDRLASLLDMLDGDRIEKNLYFAGKDSAGRLSFEWGFGYHLSAKMEDVTDEYGNFIGTELFFGDRIAAFTLRKAAESEFGWNLVISQTDIYQEVESQVLQDAEQQIVQILRIEKDEEHQLIKILEVSVKERKFQNSRKQKNGWSFKPIFNARLDAESNWKLFNDASHNEEIIFAMLNQMDYQRFSHGLEFTYIPINGIGDELSLLNNKVVCLTAGAIEKIKNKKDRINFANDYKIDFFLPNEIPNANNETIVRVTVLRRDFSLDESILRVLFNKDPDIYKGCNFLVRLINITKVRKSGAWFGSVLAAPLRSTENLKEWLKNQDSNLVTIGTPNQHAKNQLCAEIFPGILFRLPEQQGWFAAQGGTLASLQLDDGEIISSIVMPSDAKYIPDNGFKPVELLIMDGVLNHYTPDNVEGEENSINNARRNQTYGAHFTIAGFPQLRLFDSLLLEKLVRQEPPRIAAVTKDSNGKFSVNLSSLIHAGYLVVSETTKCPVIKMIYPEKREIPSSWNRLSFKDGTVNQIAEYVCKGMWHYHEQVTGVYSDESGQMLPRLLPNGDNYQDILVFFEKGFGNELSLRYRSKIILTFGMSAREIIENGLTVSNSKTLYLAVAESTDRSIWVELFPGKVLEIPSAYLFIGKDKTPLTNLCTRVFTAGDELLLQKAESRYGEQNGICLSDVKFGARSVFLNKRAFWPICDEPRTEESRNSILIGMGLWTLRYPMREEDKPDLNSARMLMIDTNNEIIPDSVDLILQNGDCVMLTLNGTNKLMIIGREKLKVKLSREEDWDGVQWLYNMLQNDVKGTMALFNNSLPVRINGMSSDGKIVYVSYHQQECIKIDEGTTLCCNCINRYKDVDQVYMVILRSGGYLFQVRAIDLIDIPQENYLQCVLNEISEIKHSFYLTKTKTGWKSGLNLIQTVVEREISMLYHIPECHGILCQDKRDFSLLWLPIENACHINNVNQNILWDILKEKRDRTAVILNRSVISLNDAERSMRQYQLLSVSDNSYRALLRREIEKNSTHYKYLCEMYPSGELIVLKSEVRRNCCEEARSENDITYVEIIQKAPESIVAIPREEHRYKINLSTWILSAYRQAYKRNSMEEETYFVDLVQWHRYIPDQFKRYSEAVLHSESDFKNETISDLFYLYSTEEQLVYIYCALRKYSPNRKFVGVLYRKAKQSLQSWLRKSGKLLATGFNEQLCSSLDLLPTLAAILLLSDLNTRQTYEDSISDCQRLAVHLTRMLGYACGNSIHQEVLLNLWLLLGNKRGLWSRLQRLSLGGKTRIEKLNESDLELFDGQLTVEQKRFVDEIAGSIVFNYPEENDLKLTAMSLLHAVGEKIDYTEFLHLLKNKEFICEKLAYLGRALTPPNGRATAHDSLGDKPKELLKWAFNKIIRSDVPKPIDLLTNIIIPLTEDEKRNVLKLHNSVCNYLSNQQRRSSKQ